MDPCGLTGAQRPRNIQGMPPDAINVKSTKILDNSNKFCFSATHTRWTSVNADFLLECGFDDGSDSYSSVVLIVSPESALDMLQVIRGIAPHITAPGITGVKSWIPKGRRELRFPPTRATAVYFAVENNAQVCELAFGFADMIGLFSDPQTRIKDGVLQIPAFARIDMATPVLTGLVRELETVLKSRAIAGAEIHD